MTPTSELISGSIFFRFSFDFDLFWRNPDPLAIFQSRHARRAQIGFVWELLFVVLLTPSWIDFGANLAPTGPPKIDFAAILDSPMVPESIQNRSQIDACTRPRLSLDFSFRNVCDIRPSNKQSRSKPVGLLTSSYIQNFPRYMKNSCFRISSTFQVT